LQPIPDAAGEGVTVAASGGLHLPGMTLDVQETFEKPPFQDWPRVEISSRRPAQSCIELVDAKSGYP
jgi:hypothetical protein